MMGVMARSRRANRRRDGYVLVWFALALAVLLGMVGLVIDAGSGMDEDSHVLRLQWTPSRHVLIQRDWGPFTPIERRRASALLRLSAAIARLSGDDDQIGWIDPVRDGTVWIRLASCSRMYSWVRAALL